MDTKPLYKTATREFRSRWIEYIYHLQDRICTALEEMDGKASFQTDEWERNAGKGGGGKTRVMDLGNVFEKAGVNSSVVYGPVTETMKKMLQMDGRSWFACGLSLVIHPRNPYVPTVHANWRFFELYDDEGYVKDRWFGGGTDLTPYYLFEEDARHFHKTLRDTLDTVDPELYPLYKKNCDAYFSNTHREGETRGIGGIFYDHLRPVSEADAEHWLNFQQLNGNSFLEAYLPIVRKRKDTLYGDRETFWQEIRRGRYVEFNLIHDRGTLFGLKTKGRIESILMSLPPRARWIYDHHPDPGSPEAKLLDVCLSPRDWA
jgi:coproporphyrinogen III oxidase